MRSLQQAKSQGQSYRSLVERAGTSLLDALRDYLFEHYQIEALGVPAGIIDGSRAEISPSERVINYDERLNRKPQELLWTLAHELGHLVLHKRLTSVDDHEPDPLLGSAYLNNGVTGLARYSRKSREEAEANAFANEFLCPALNLFSTWLADDQLTAKSLAKTLDLPLNLIQVQLAEGLLTYSSGQPDNDDNQTRSKRTRSHAAAPTIVNDKQFEAATFIGGPALVTAGPGTGKTSTLIRRIEFLLTEQKATPASLLVLTFSNDAAEELRERVAQKFDETTANEIEISTFHGFGMSFLHTYALGLQQEFTLLDEVAQEQLISELLASVEVSSLLNLRDLGETVKKIIRHIGYLKDRVLMDQLITPELLSKDIMRQAEIGADPQDIKHCQELLNIYYAYEETKCRLSAVDFADLISLPIQEMTSNPKLTTALRNKYRWVMVDEYQDVSRTVALLLRLICGPENPPWVVGDMRQAIYRFRGAAPENVRDFRLDFPNAKEFELNVNYRSCAEIVEAANQLARLLISPEESANFRPWQAGSKQKACLQPAVSLVRVNSDEAESAGIANQVLQWLEHGIAPNEIAVLARRNVDVRNIVLALGQRNIEASISGLLTTDGAAGDLAAICTLPEAVATSLPRLVYALNNNRYSKAELDQWITAWLAALQNEVDPMNWPVELVSNDFHIHLQKTVVTLQLDNLSADAFSFLCTFLFDASDYLRQNLLLSDSASKSLKTCEIVSVLSQAASFRVTHKSTKPKQSRLAFAELLRTKLSSSLPTAEPPQAQLNAVRVMTCHASKGLEFPCVVVAGQTMSSLQDHWWLPVSMIPQKLEETDQADALLFVGVTRAQRSVVVSYAESKSGSEQARQRKLPPLILNWKEQHQPVEMFWEAHTSTSESIAVTDLWGGQLRKKIATRQLDLKSCAVKTYLEDFLGTRFPVVQKPLYPIFYHALRSTFAAIMESFTTEKFNDLSPSSVFTEHFNLSKLNEHPHFKIYQRAGISFANSFFTSYQAKSQSEEILLLDSLPASLAPFKIELVALTKSKNNNNFNAYLFRLESLADGVSKKDPEALLWSSLDTAQRSVFLLMRQQYPELQPWVFSAIDKKLYRLLWNNNELNMSKEYARLFAKWQEINSFTFVTTPNEYMCGRCAVRLCCPHWMNELS